MSGIIDGGAIVTSALGYAGDLLANFYPVISVFVGVLVVGALVGIIIKWII